MKTARLAALLTLCVLAVPLFAQQRVKMCFQLMNYLNMPHAEDAQVDVFIHGDQEATGTVIRAHGGLVKQALPRLVNARVPVAAIHSLAQDPAIERFEFSMDGMTLLNDSARVKSRVNEVHSGLAPLPQGYQGEDVIVGIVDTGLDVTHPDFHDGDGGTRVLKYWAQHLTGPFEPAQFGYGQVYDQDQINNDVMPAAAYESSGHGTSVTGIAVGGGTANGMHTGMAPKADIMVVKISSGNFRSKVADAVNFIFTEAEALGRPAVVNISLGTQLGSHDGLDAAALFIDDMLQASGGRVVVCAAGNFNEVEFWDRYHLRTTVTADTSFTWFRHSPQVNFGTLGMGGVLIEGWADAADLQNVQFAIGADRVTPGYQYRGRTPFHNLAQNAGVIFTDTLYSSSGNRLGVANMLALPRGDQYQVQFWMVQPDSSAYNFRLMSTGTGAFDVWAPRNHGVSRMVPYSYGDVALAPSVAEYPPMANYVHPDNEQHITDSWTCSPHVITVGNYRNETGYEAYDGSWQQGVGIVEGEITASSSKGPTRDGRIKPEIAAPGDVTFSAYPMDALAIMVNMPNEVIKLAPGGMHIRGGGTSAASPHVAGIVALYLEKCPSATYSEIRSALFSTAVDDEHTGITPNIQWGEGKVDAFAALNTSNLDDFDLALIGEIPFCEGVEVTIQGPSGYAAYEWSNGDTESEIQYGQEGPLSLIAFNSSHCSAYSDTLVLSTLPAPDVPLISADANVLTSTPAMTYQWFFNGEAIEGADAQVHEAMVEGEYHVWITGDNGCGAASEPLLVLSTSIQQNFVEDVIIWPSPASEHLNILTTENGVIHFSIFDGSGRKLYERSVNGGTGITVLPISGLNVGTYVLRIDGEQESSVHRFVKVH